MRKICLIIFSLFIISNSFADGSQYFDLELKKDLTLSGIGIGLFTTGYLLKDGPRDLEPFGWFDEGLNLSYNEQMDDIGSIISLSTLAALPLLLDDFELDSMVTIGTMYAETALIAYGLKDILKAVIQRPRPYNFNGENLPAHISGDDDRYYSFPSGHTTVAFMTATFSTYVFSKGNMKTRDKWLLGIGSYSLALTTAILRISSGAHYPMDVVAGAILGSGVGLLVPLLHFNYPL